MTGVGVRSKGKYTDPEPISRSIPLAVTKWEADNGRTARIDQEAGNIELTGDNNLLAECVRLLKKEGEESLNKVNTANYIRTNLKHAGLYVRTNKKGSK